MSKNELSKDEIKRLLKIIEREKNNNKAKEELIRYLGINKKNIYDIINLLLEIALETSDENIKNKIKKLQEKLRNEELSFIDVLELIKDIRQNGNKEEKKGGEKEVELYISCFLLIFILLISILRNYNREREDERREAVERQVQEQYRAVYGREREPETAPEEDAVAGGIQYFLNRTTTRSRQLTFNIRDIAGACIDENGNVIDSFTFEIIADGDTVIYFKYGGKFYIFNYNSLNGWFRTIGRVIDTISRGAVTAFVGRFNLRQEGGRRRTHRKKLGKIKAKKSRRNKRNIFFMS
jgi:hypothetical protein